MAELIHRILPSIQRFGPKRFLMLGGPTGALFSGFDALPGYWQQVLDFYGVDRETLMVTHQDVVVDHLQIVEQGASFGIPPKPWYLPMLREFALKRFAELQPASADYDKVYVSRSRLVPSGGMLGERYIEIALERSGFFVFHPQEGHSLVEQVAQYMRAKQLIFAEGSACHGAEILGGGMLGDVGVILRRKSHAGLFEEVLSPRSSSYRVFDAINVLGTLAIHPHDGSLQDNYGVSVVDIDCLRDFFYNCFSHAIDLDRAHYRSSAFADLETYIDHYGGSAESVTQLRATAMKALS